jgi:formiminoglutamase
MDFTALIVDVPPQPWMGRFDGEEEEHRRWWQAVRPYEGVPVASAAGATASAANASPAALPAGPDTRPAAILGFSSDEGVRRNNGRVGSAAAPAVLRDSLGSLAFHLKRRVFDAGDVAVTGTKLEAGQARAGLAVTAMLDAGNLTVMLGGGHETAFASYLGVAHSAAVLQGKRLGVLNLDAHFDLREQAEPTSGTPFLQMAVAEAAAERSLNYAVVGISEPNNTQALFKTAGRLGVKYLQDEDCTVEQAQGFVADFLDDVDILYLTIDLDVLPASVAPGVSAPAAYGVPLPVITAICRQVAASGKLFHLDVAELNPALDIDRRTARVAARLINTLLS